MSHITWTMTLLLTPDSSLFCKLYASSSSPPGKLVHGGGPVLCGKTEEKIHIDMLVLVSLCARPNPRLYACMILIMRNLDDAWRYTLFDCTHGLRLALYKGLYATWARFVQKVVVGVLSGLSLWVVLAKMFDVLGVAHRNSIIPW